MSSLNLDSRVYVYSGTLEEASIWLARQMQRGRIEVGTSRLIRLDQVVWYPATGGAVLHPDRLAEILTRWSGGEE